MLAAAALLANAGPAHAFLGFGEGTQQAEAYTKDTGAILEEVQGIMKLAKDDPSKDERINALRGDINGWVAKYRREPKFSGKPSYGNTYSALNALAGHYNSFGTSAPIPKKRLERLQKELNDAQLLLSRNR